MGIAGSSVCDACLFQCFIFFYQCIHLLLLILHLRLLFLHCFYQRHYKRFIAKTVVVFV